MLCCMDVPCSTSLVSTVPQLTWVKMHLLRKNILCMYVTHVAKSGIIVAHRCRATLYRRFSCSWLAVTCCLVSTSCRLPQHCSMHVATKQPSVNRAIPLGDYTACGIPLIRSANGNGIPFPLPFVSIKAYLPASINCRQR